MKPNPISLRASVPGPFSRLREKAGDEGRPQAGEGAEATTARPGPSARLLIAAVRGYRLLLSPWLGNACRFEPTCSVYAIGAIEQHGAAAGALLATGRILRCHPWCRGGIDPVPEAAPRLFGKRIGGRRAPSSHHEPSP